jgi:hypothetical protein
VIGLLARAKIRQQGQFPIYINQKAKNTNPLQGIFLTGD